MVDCGWWNWGGCGRGNDKGVMGPRGWTYAGIVLDAFLDYGRYLELALKLGGHLSGRGELDQDGLSARTYVWLLREELKLKTGQSGLGLYSTHHLYLSKYKIQASPNRTCEDGAVVWFSHRISRPRPCLRDDFTY